MNADDLIDQSILEMLTHAEAEIEMLRQSETSARVALQSQVELIGKKLDAVITAVAEIKAANLAIVGAKKSAKAFNITVTERDAAQQITAARITL